MEFILMLAVLLVLSVISCGLYYIKRGAAGVNAKKILGINIASIFSLLIIATFLLAAGIVHAAGNEGQSAGANAQSAGSTAQSAGSVAQAEGSVNGLGLLAAALSTGLATIGAGIAVAISSSAAIGAISEDSNLLGKSLIFVGLSEGIAIYGLIVSIIILGRL